jgi:hypothetical protein
MNNRDFFKKTKQFNEELLAVKKVRLVEDHMTYEDLAL